MDTATLLLVTILLPLAGAVALWPVAALGTRAVRWTALAVTLATLLLTVLVIWDFYPDHVASTEREWTWLGAGEQIQFGIGLDGISVWLFALSALLMVTAVLVSWEAIDDQVPQFYALLLLLECGCLGVFAARDLIMFYVFFEFTLIPLYFLIGIWGSEDRKYAASKFFLFTLAGSLLTFLGLLSIVWWKAAYVAGGELTFSIAELAAAVQQAAGTPRAMSPGFQAVLFAALFAGFAIKVPLFPLHTWLPLAHVQAPTAGSVFLAGILLKLGSYGFVRFCLPLLPDATYLFAPWILWIAVIGILYGALIALAQHDLKRLIAYSSVSHLGYCLLGVFALNPLGLQGGTLQMVNHGLSTGGLFALVGMLYERYHTRDIQQLSGLARQVPRLAFFMLVFTLSSIGLPGLNGFVGEFLVLLAMFQRAWQEPLPGWGLHLKAISVLAVFGVVLGAWYMLWLVQRVFFGPLKHPSGGHDGAPPRDLAPREILALAPLAVVMVWIGVAPNFFLRPMDGPLREVEAAVARPLQEGLQNREPVAEKRPQTGLENLTRAR
ncbi:MAG: NADH-quinone oxidoreductase subunit M [Pirellulaceae bacterium]|nr:NADH-quinone oxidoreductase subunit M [Pirellulaceae bacterium]